MHLSATPKGRATLTFTLCFLSPSLFSPFADVVNGGTSQLICHVYEWHRARGEAGAPCQKWRTSLLHALCLADPICPNTDGHKIGLCGTAGLESIRRAIFEQSFSHVSPAFQLLQAQWSFFPQMYDAFLKRDKNILVLICRNMQWCPQDCRSTLCFMALPNPPPQKTTCSYLTIIQKYFIIHQGTDFFIVFKGFKSIYQ